MLLLFLVRALCSVANVLTLACGDCLDNCRYMVYTNKLSTLVDLLAFQMKVRLINVNRKEASIVH